MSNLNTRKLEIDPKLYDVIIKSRIQILEKIASTLDVEEVLKRIVEAAVELSNADGGSLLLLDKETGQLYMRAAKDFGENQASTLWQQVDDDTLAGQIMTTGKPVLVGPETNRGQIKIRTGCLAYSALNLPLKQGSIVYGVLAVYNSANQTPFTHEHLMLLAPLANYAAIAIENAHHYQQTNELLGDSYILFDIAGLFTQTYDLDDLLNVIADVTLKRIDPADRVVIHLYNEATSQLEYKIRLPMLEDSAATSGFAIGEGVAGRVLQENRPICINNIKNEPAFVSRGITFGALLVAPISWRSNCIGTMSVASLYENAFTQRNERFLTSLANLAALAIRNARQFEYMHERLRRRMGELQSLQNIERLISSTPDLEKMLKSILEVSLKLVNAECGHIALTDDETGLLMPKVSYPETALPGDRYNLGLSGWVAKVHKTARIRNLPQTQWINTYLGIQVRSELAAPILVGEELVGVIDMGSPKIDIFTQEDESLLDILATQTAVAIQTARYYQELEQSRRRSYEAERIAAMGDIASNMVHNINNSVGAIRVLVQQIRSKLNQDAVTPEFLLKKLEGIEKSAEKTLTMARSIRDPFQSLATEPTDVNGCIRAALRDFEPLPSTLDINLDLVDNLPPVMATQQLKEVFWNLLNNAAQSMQGVGRVEITSKQTEEALEISVTDTGSGLSENMTATSIFNLGVSSKSDGMGYGLWWCKIYLNRVGGTINLDTGYKSGCRFRIKLPL